MRRIAVIAAAIALASTVKAGAPVPVAVELVLALDASASVDAREFRLQLDGLAIALKDPDVGKAIDNLKPLGAAIAIVQWGGPDDTRVVIPFTHLASARDAKALGHVAGLIQRWHRASETSIAAAMRDGSALIESNEFDGGRKVIDISGDGPDNGGIDLAWTRAQMGLGGITVNGLAIEHEDRGLPDYYRDHVITGDGAFVETARDYEDFARAMREKLLRELRPLSS
jgi:hypothetical protein